MLDFICKTPVEGSSIMRFYMHNLHKATTLFEKGCREISRCGVEISCDANQTIRMLEKAGIHNLLDVVTQPIVVFGTSLRRMVHCTEKARADIGQESLEGLNSTHSNSVIASLNS